MNKISVVVLTRNEEKNIGRCLENLKWADDIVVVDQFSTDRTVDICNRYKARVFKREMDGFAQQKQYGVDKALCDWVFVMDADEVADNELKAAIIEWKQTQPTFHGYEVYRKTFYLDKWIKYCNWYQPIVRFFNRKKGQLDGRVVHENITVNGKIGRLKGNILHYTYEDLTHHISKINLYTSYEAKEIAERGIVLKPTNYFTYFILKPIYGFFSKYFIQKGYKEGAQGLFLSVITAFIIFFNYAKLWEVQQIKTESDEKTKS